MEFGKRRFDVFLAGEPSFVRSAQATIDARQLLIARLIFTARHAGVDLERQLGKLVLQLGRPSRDPFKNVCELFCLHGTRLAQS
ncbi:hypothetical protein [Bradyrhizobium sp. SRS-191]|uniref:hypothetical protein n=1 Tax=Bradyrhizobium sp. SRS-191 TaxID=2962606 RepID=UPI0035BC8DE3